MSQYCGLGRFGSYLNISAVLEWKVSHWSNLYAIIPIDFPACCPTFLHFKSAAKVCCRTTREGRNINKGSSVERWRAGLHPNRQRVLAGWAASSVENSHSNVFGSRRRLQTMVAAQRRLRDCQPCSTSLPISELILKVVLGLH